MARGKPSGADAALTDTLTAEGLSISAAKLERWRALGLLPRVTVERRGFGGSAVGEHPAETYEACRLIAENSGTGTQWQHVALSLFTAGHNLSTDAVRGAADVLVDLQTRDIIRAWERAEVGVKVVKSDTERYLEAVADRTVTLLPNEFAEAIRDEVKTAHPNVKKSILDQYAHRAVRWRIADIAVPWQLTDDQRRLARTGSNEPLDLLDGVLIPLPSERAACAKTLTWAEANVGRWWVWERAERFIEVAGVLGATLWWVTNERLYEDFSRPDLPITEAGLQSSISHLSTLEPQVIGQEELPLDM